MTAVAIAVRSFVVHEEHAFTKIFQGCFEKKLVLPTLEPYR